MPAEWAPHAAVWTAWPYLEDQWAEGLDAPRRALAAMIEAIVDGGDGERVELLVRKTDEASVRAAVGSPAIKSVRFHHIPYGDIWLRDTGPIFVARRDATILATRYRFDGWGGKYVMAGDADVAAEIVRHLRIRCTSYDFVLEGGAIDVDGAGALLTTKQCLLGGGRNPGLDQVALDARLRFALGVDRVVWLDRGLQNDHTDGHVDTIARFVAPGVVACMEPAADDPNRDALRGVIDDVGAAGFEIVTLPSPGTVVDASGTLLPASYTNFYIANTTVVVPIYGVASDDAAVAAIAALYPTRRAVAIHATPVVVGGGAFHCATQQQPR